MKTDDKIPILLIGIGNEFRKDDGVGLVVARKIAAKNIRKVAVMEYSGEGTSLMEAWRHAQTVILVDAIASGGQAGTIHHFEAHRENIPANFFNYSTHAFSVAEAVELSRALGKLPEIVHVYGIEGEDFAAGAGLSVSVENKIEKLTEQIMQEITILLIRNHLIKLSPV
ncbi:hydrogenase maturation protease [bacterium]|nr:hydrogenase maturation protease [bacterium]